MMLGASAIVIKFIMMASISAPRVVPSIQRNQIMSWLSEIIEHLTLASNH